MRVAPQTSRQRTARRAVVGALALLATVCLWRTRRAPTVPVDPSWVGSSPVQPLGSVSTASADPSDFTLCLARLRAESPNDSRAERVTRLVVDQSHRDPARVARAILDEPDDAFRRLCLTAFLNDWAAQFPLEAADWLVADQTSGRQRWASTVIAALIETPSALLEFVSRLAGRDKDNANQYLHTAVATLSDVGSFRLALTLTALSDDSLVRDPLRQQLISDWAQVDAPSAAAWVRTLVNSPEKDVLLGRLVENWSATDPQAAANFANAELPEGLGGINALTIALTEWTSRDAVAASAWLADRADSSEYDTPIFAFATHPRLAALHPSLAAMWVEEISNPDVRLQGFRTVLKEWSVQDPAAARKFLLVTPSLSEQFRRTLLAEMDGG